MRRADLPNLEAWELTVPANPQGNADGRPPRRARWPWLLLIPVLAVAIPASAWLWLMHTDASELWIHRAEETLAQHGCPSHLGTLRTARFPATVVLGPVSLCEDAAGEPLLVASTLKVKARARALLHGQLSAAVLQLEGAELNGGRLLKRLRATPTELKRPTGKAGGGPVEWDTLRVHDLVVKLPEAAHAPDQHIDELILRRGADGGQLDVTREDGAHAQLLWTAPAGSRAGAPAEGWSADLALDVPGGWRWIKGGRLLGHVQSREGSTASRGTAQASFTLENLTVATPALSEEPLGPWTYTGQGDLEWDAPTRQLTALHWELKGGPMQQSLLQASAELLGRPPVSAGTAASGEPPEPLGSVAIAVSDVPMGDWLNGLPPALRPPDDVPRLSAPLRAMLRWSGPLTHLDESTLELSLDLKLLRAASRDVPWALRSGFSHVPRVGATPGARTLWIGDTNPDYVPLTAVPGSLVKAVLVSEDAGFYGHAGFEIEEVRKSLWDPKERARHRGASTLTQQLAKNLFLDGEHTYARKVREALSTVTLEAALSKARILELYLNVIEWGPGIYGIGEASQHYFGVPARSLTPKQSAFLASIIPNPVRYHTYYDQGELTETWEARVRDVLGKLRDTDVVSEEEYQDAVETPLQFAK